MLNTSVDYMMGLTTEAQKTLCEVDRVAMLVWIYVRPFKNIKEMCKEVGIEHSSFCKKLKQIGRSECYFSRHTAFALADYFDVPVEYLTNGRYERNTMLEKVEKKNEEEMLKRIEELEQALSLLKGGLSGE